MITSEPVLAYLPEVVFPRYDPNRPTGLEVTLTADAISLDPARNRSAPLMLRTGGAYADLPPRPISFCELLRGARMSDRTDWLRNLSTEELLFMHKAYEVIHKSMCWTIEFYRAAGEIRQELAGRGQLVCLNNESKSRFDE